MTGPEYGIFSESGELIDRGFETEQEAFDAMCSTSEDMTDFISKICQEHLQPQGDCEMCE